jgi:hypothetical protein
MIGVGFLLISSLPWLGLASFYAFAIPGYEFTLPRLEWMDSERLYKALCVPLDLVAKIPPLRQVVYFTPRFPRIVGYPRVNPFVLFLFYFLLGAIAIWLALRGRSARKGDCPACGYDLRGTPGNECPECGAAREAKT